MELLTTEPRKEDGNAGEGEGEGMNDGVVMVNFAPMFVAADGEATVERVADHIEHIANVAGKEQYVCPSVSLRSVSSGGVVVF